MSNALKARYRDANSSAPAAAQLQVGEIVLNHPDKRMYFKDAGGNIQTVFPALTGDVSNTAGSLTVSIGAGKVTNSMLANNAVTYAKMQNVSGTGLLLGRSSAGSGVVEEISTIPSTILGNSSLYIGTTQISLNRGSGAQVLTGITSIDGYLTQTNTGKTGNIGFLTPGLNSQATWANYPVGLGSMIANLQSGNGSPNDNYQYFFKVANRDVSGGWSGISIDYNTGVLYAGTASTSASYATWLEQINASSSQSLSNKKLVLSAGTASANTSPLKFTSGVNLTTPESGATEYDGTNLYFSPSTTRKRVLLTNNATPSNGQIPIGNGTDYTVAALTGTSNQITVTNASGSITLSTPQDIATSSSPTFKLLSIAATTAGDTMLSLSAGAANPLNVKSYNNSGTYEPVLETPSALRISSTAFPNAQFRILPYTTLGSNDIYIQNTDSTGDIYFTGLNSTFCDQVFFKSNYALFGGALKVGNLTSNPTALLHLSAGTASANTAPLKFTSGVNLTTPESGATEYDGTNLYFSPSTTRKRVPLTNNATPSNGQIPIGNGTDYTVAAITGTSNQITVTNASGSITLSTPQNIDSTATPNFRGVRWNDYDSYFRTSSDVYHGLGYYGGAKTWNSVSVDGPVLYGYSGGALGSYPTTQKIALFWNSSNQVGIGTTSPGSILDIQGGDIRLADTTGQTSYALKSYSNATSFWMYPSAAVNPSLVLADAFNWDRSVAFTYAPGTTGALSGILTIGQMTRNNANFTHGVTALYTNGTERLRINAIGQVGIGTTSPSVPLEVSGNGSKTASYGYLNSSGGTGTGSGTNNYSIWASDRIKASEFNAVSDSRIKKNISNIKSAKDLINNINPVSFNYIDSISKGEETKFGLIAQEVEVFLPDAVKKIPDFIPSIFEKTDSVSTQGNKTILKISKPHELSNHDIVRLITEDGIFEKQVNVTAPNEFEVEDLSLKGRSVFVFGKKVQDFRVIDYDSVFSIGLKAIKELLEEVESLKKRIAHL